MKAIFLLLILCMCSVVLPFRTYAEYYQYKGADGAVHFTDNLADVPRNQRSDVKQLTGISTESPRESVAPSQDSNTVVTDKGAAKPSSATWDGRLRITAQKLDREKARLDKLFDRLTAERKHIGKPPAFDSSVQELQAYDSKVNALNRQIDAYGKKRAAFQKKVDAFNAKIKQ